ncbi:hypothetical protein C8J57DRAFT_1234210 [Mycena rebaudengoi]|nr:hypothetical protein C8J57DRAFT_1234210 [Mycena rebaudengoi]
MKNDEHQLRLGTRTGEREGGRKYSRAGDATSTLRSSFGGYTNRNLFPWIKDTQDVSIPKDSRRVKPGGGVDVVGRLSPMPTLDVVRPAEVTSLEACVARVHRGGRRKASSMGGAGAQMAEQLKKKNREDSYPTRLTRVERRTSTAKVLIIEQIIYLSD